MHAGGRGKSGGVQLIDNPEQAIEFAQKWLGNRLITYQTDAFGQIVNSILIEECTDIAQELYLSAVIDRDTQKIVFIGSSEGGVNIEEVAKNSPEKIIYQGVDFDDKDFKSKVSAILLCILTFLSSFGCIAIGSGIFVFATTYLNKSFNLSLSIFIFNISISPSLFGITV